MCTCRLSKPTAGQDSDTVQQKYTGGWAPGFHKGAQMKQLNEANK